ncbi:MAG TPA: MFS transporter [Natronosporangium sp.]|nr:MFS transporter [Natronosporangium sp.]
MDKSPTEATTVDRAGDVRAFRVIWFGQLLAAIGSSLTGFVLGVWVYQSTGSATQFAIIFMASSLPGVFISPFAGAIADRFDRRWLMVVGNAAGGTVVGVLALLLWTDLLQIWHIYLTTTAVATFGVMHATAFYAVTPQLVPKDQLGRANGLLQITQAARIAAPLIAGMLLATIGLQGVILLDLAATGFAIVVLLMVPVAKRLTVAPGAGERSSFFRDLGYGWWYLRRRGSGLLWLVTVFAGFNFCYAMAGVLVQPLILSFSDEVTLGVLMFCGGSGFFVGSLVMSIWKGPRQRVRAILLILPVAGVVLALHGLRPSPWLIGVVAPLFLFTLPVLMAVSMALIQTKVESAAMGRVIAAVRMIGQSAMPVAYLLAGPLADRVAEPAMAPGGALADSVGRLIGTGNGRGIALLFCAVGLLLVLIAVIGASSARLRRLEVELPDADHQAPAGADTAESVTQSAPPASDDDDPAGAPEDSGPGPEPGISTPAATPTRK